MLCVWRDIPSNRDTVGNGSDMGVADDTYWLVVYTGVGYGHSSACSFAAEDAAGSESVAAPGVDD